MQHRSWRVIFWFGKSRSVQGVVLPDCCVHHHHQSIQCTAGLRLSRRAYNELRCAMATRSHLASAAATLGDEEWGLTTEEMDSMERNAVQELAARKLGSPFKALQQKPPISPVGKRPIRVKVFKEGVGKIAVEAPYNSSLLAAYKSVSGYEWDPSRRLWLFPEQHLQDVLGAVTATPELVIDIQPVPPLVLPSCGSHFVSSNSVHGLSPQNSPAKSQDRLNLSQPTTPSKEIIVQIYLIDDNRIAARSPYNQNVKEACQSIPGKLWNGEEKIWTFPRTQLQELIHALQNNPSFPRIKVEVVPPLVASDRCEIAASSNRDEGCPTPTPTPTPAEKEPVSLVSRMRHPVKLFLHSSGLVAVRCQPNPKLIATLRSIPKATWHQREMLWMFPPRFLAEAETKLAAVDDVSCVVDSLEPLVRRALDFQRDIPDLTEHYRQIPSQLESNLMPFQREGVRFALQHGGRVLIADEMGLGKTVQGIALVSCFQDAWPVLVIVPSSLRLHWATMLKGWLGVNPGDITVVLSQGGSSNREGFTIAHSAGKTSLRLGGLFNIISYDMVAKLSADNKFQVIIADESHYMKNAQAKRTNACVPLIQKAKHAVLLTGTPALSRPIELFKQLEALQPRVYSDVHDYGKRYCSGSLFGLYQGTSNHEELHALLKSTIMIRRLKNEVLSQLPEKSREQVILGVDLKNTKAKELRALLKELKQLRETIQCSTDDQIEEMKKHEKVLINKIYSESATVKIPAVQEYLSTMLEANCKFLVFAHHRSMMDGIETHLQKHKTDYIRIDGETAPLARQSLVNKFQESDKVRAAVLSIRAAGVGLTLTAASTIIFAEMSWTPGEMVQAEDRAHRIGQRSSVNVYYLHAQETIDDFIWESIHRKLGNLGQVLNGREEKLHASPSQQKQGKLNSYLRPCSRNLSERYDAEAAGGSSQENADRNQVSKRLKLEE